MARRIRLLATQYFEPAESASRILPMEGMRGFAVLAVFFVHWHSLFSRYVSVSTVTWHLSEYGYAIGNVGVDIFFILSGYLIYGSIIRKRTGLILFLRRRVHRIYPTFICVFAIYLVVMSCEPSVSKVDWHKLGGIAYLIENLLLLPGILPIIPIITVAWSLSYEFCFYLTMPIAVQFLQMRTWTRRYRVFSLCLATAIYASLVGMGYATHIRMLMFVSGMLLYEATQVSYFISYLTASGEVIAIGLFLLALVFVALVELHPLRLNFLPGAPHWVPVYRTLLLGLAGFVFTFYSFSFDGLLNRAFSTTALRWLGNMSYSYYLIHGLSLHVLAIFVSRAMPRGAESVLSFWLILPVAFLITLVASAALFLLVERPISLNYMSSAGRLPSPSPTMA